MWAGVDFVELRRKFEFVDFQTVDFHSTIAYHQDFFIKNLTCRWSTLRASFKVWNTTEALLGIMNSWNQPIVKL